MDAGKYYALLRFEEASVGLRLSLKLGIVDRLAGQRVSYAEFREMFGFTMQGCRTYVALLEVMDIVERVGDTLTTTERARQCLSTNQSTSREPYLRMGMSADVDQLNDVLCGRLPEDSLPLYGGDDVANTIMDVPDAAREIAFGLASRARNFSGPLSEAVMKQAGSKAKIVADIGAGSPYLAEACLAASPYLQKVVLVDRTNSMQFAREMADPDHPHREKIEYREQDFFQAVPAADVYCISNTAHDWLPDEYAHIMTNVRDAIAPGGLVCIHEPVLLDSWRSADEWVHALWMACYAMTLFRLTEGKGTCYTQREHHDIMARIGFQQVGTAVPTRDGCTALFYKLERDVQADGMSSTQTQSQPA